MHTWFGLNLCHWTVRSRRIGVHLKLEIYLFYMKNKLPEANAVHGWGCCIQYTLSHRVPEKKKNDTFMVGF